MSRFQKVEQKLKSSPLWKEMLNTYENSPWHREANVAEHTRMALSWYKNNLSFNRNETQQFLTQTAILFHDVGKPMAEVVKFKEERGTYRAYSGHEQLSSRLWVDFALSHKELCQSISLGMNDISKVALMIEYHVPYGYKDCTKRINLKNALISKLGETGHRAWLDLLLSDQHGRISDNHADKITEVSNWLQDWENLNA